MASKKFDNAKNGKNDEFYTSYDDIKKELINYAKHFKGKTIYCNCDDHNGIGLGSPKSNFLKYFADNFQAFGLKKVIATHYEKGKKSSMYILTKDNTGDGIICNEDIEEIPLKDDGDFRNKECIELLKQADIVITNPPFSLFREYVAQLMDYDKKFIIIGNINALFYKEIFPFIKTNEMWAGHGFNISMVYKTLYKNNLESNRKFVKSKGYNPDDNYIKTPACCWFTNLSHNKRTEKLETGKKYRGYEKMYPKYDNYDAINMDKVSDIPMDYDDVMGVPITFLDKWNPEQFEIIDGLNRYTILDIAGINEWAQKNHIHLTEINGKSTYARLLIRKKKGN